MTNDNAPEYVCADCGSTLDFAFAMRADEKQPVPQAVKDMTLSQNGWCQIGDNWFCGKHEMRVL